MSYLDTAHRLYRDAAATVQKSLCCTSGPRFQLPGMVVPQEMEEMNYGCGTTVHLQDLSPSLDVLYIGVGSGLEALQFAYFTRRPKSVIAVDRVPEMLEVARRNFAEAERTNPWFRSEFVELVEGDALKLPLPDARVDLVAQNCLFNIFTPEHLDVALADRAKQCCRQNEAGLTSAICERQSQALAVIEPRRQTMGGLCERVQRLLELSDELQPLAHARKNVGHRRRRVVVARYG